VLVYSDGTLASCFKVTVCDPHVYEPPMEQQASQLEGPPGGPALVAGCSGRKRYRTRVPAPVPHSFPCELPRHPVKFFPLRKLLTTHQSGRLRHEFQQRPLRRPVGKRAAAGRRRRPVRLLKSRPEYHPREFLSRRPAAPPPVGTITSAQIVAPNRMVMRLGSKFTTRIVTSA